MKRALPLLGLVVIAVLGLLLYAQDSGTNDLTLNDQTLEQDLAVEADDVDRSDAEILNGATEGAGSDDAELADSALLQPLPPADVRSARISRLADGDSFDIVWNDSQERDEVRLFGINAPEGGACYGDVASDVLEILTEDQDILVESIERDEFGRVLGNVWVQELFVNATMVELGAALVLSDGGQHAALITQAQEVAKGNRAGLWDPEFCGADESANLSIAWIESDAPGRDDQNKNGEWIEIANDGAVATDLTGWMVRDESTRHRYNFPTGFILAPGASVRVFSGCGDDTSDELYWCDADPVWNNGGDTGFLVDADGRFVDTRSYTG